MSDNMILLGGWQAASLGRVLRDLVRHDGNETDSVIVELVGTNYHVTEIPSMRKARIGPTGMVESVESF